MYLRYIFPLIRYLYRDTWVNNEYPILKTIMKQKEKHNIELEKAYNKILELSFFGDSLNILCIIITPPPTANEEECGIQTNNSANQMTDNGTQHQTCQPETTTSMILKNLKHSESSTQETSYNGDIVMIEVNSLSPDQNSKSPEERIGLHKTGRHHQTNMNTKKKTTEPKRATVTVEMHNNIVNTLNKMDNEMVEFAIKVS